MRLPRPFALSAIVCTMVALVLAALILRPVMVANSLRNEMLEFIEGPFSEQRLREWAARHAATLKCDGTTCEADATVYNWPLHVFGLAPETRFNAEIDTNHGNLAQTVLNLSNISYSDKPKGAATMLLVHFTRDGDTESKVGAHGVHVGQEPIGKLPTVVYSVDLNAAPHNLALAYDINVWCLARIGGCTGPQQAPEVWTLRRRK